MGKKLTGRGGPRRGQGRKATEVEGPVERFQVTLDKESERIARRIGEGDRSLGIRRALKAYPDE